MKRIDTAAFILNVVLGVLYIPLSIFSWLMMMISEATIGATNPVYITAIDVACGISFVIPFLCVAGTVASFRLRMKGRSTWSIVAQCAPTVVFLCNILLLATTDLIPSIV